MGYSQEVTPEKVPSAVKEAFAKKISQSNLYQIPNGKERL